MEKQNKKNILIRQKKLERKNERWKKIKRRRNIFNNIRNKNIEYERRNFENRKLNRQNYLENTVEKTVKADVQFSLLKNPNNVLSLVSKITYIVEKENANSIKIDLSEVMSIDIGSIGLLLSKINKLSQISVKAWGTLPDDKICKDFIYQSGFLNHMRDLKGRNFKISQENKNLLINRGFDKTSNTLVGSEIRKAVEYLTGKADSYRPVFSMVQEMCANSIEHANENNKNWLFAMCYESDRVVFTMTDIGTGILGTLKRKAAQIVTDKLGKNDIEVLDRAFNKKYISVTSDKNRNKGLPKIKKISVENFIENLIVITNNVLLDFNNEDNSKILNNKFNGTFYYWELTRNSIEKWKNRELN